MAVVLPPTGVAIRGKIWIVAAWTGGYPREDNAPFMYVYDPDIDSWETRTPLPEDRRRGSAAIVVDENEEFIYVSHGNNGGHETKDFAKSFGYLDVYDIEKDEWSIPDGGDAPNPRDHACGAMVGGRLCVAAGRNGGEKGWPVVATTDCYNFDTKQWEEEAAIPIPRGGSSCGTSCDGKLIVAGGEGNGQAYNNVHVFDGKTWEEIDSLNVQRHGSGLAVDCVCNQIHIASGASTQGGGSEIASLETYFPDGVDVRCPEVPTVAPSTMPLADPSVAPFVPPTSTGAPVACCTFPLFPACVFCILLALSLYV